MKNKMDENSLEQSIITHLKDHAGYEYISPDEMKLTFNKRFAFDEKTLLRFIKESQPKTYGELRLDDTSSKDQFLLRLSNEISRNGIIHVLKNGIKDYRASNSIIMFYLSPEPRRPSSFTEFDSNIFAITNQLTYSEVNSGLELDICIFINGLPVITMELKNRTSSSGWTYKNAEEQYKNDRSPKDMLFSFKRCLVHFAADENSVSFTTRIDGKNTRFMPFNKGTEDGGAGNPLSTGTMTEYLWKIFLDKIELTNIIENYAQVIEEKEEDKKKEIQIFPRYHQWDVVKKLLADVNKYGVGKKYLVQHSAGSGKSNSITWLAYGLVGLEKDSKSLFDSVIVVTDRRNLDDQITKNVRKFLEVSSNVGHAESASNLAELLKDGKKIIISTVQKFPFLLDTIGKSMKDKNFAIIIDEAHSSQSGKAAGSMNISLSGKWSSSDEELDFEDKLNELMESSRMITNASYFAFTATPKPRTIEMFGERKEDGTMGEFHLYSMKQAIEEGFILDVLKNYTSYESYYKIYKTIEDNPKFDSKKARKKLRKFVEGQEFPLMEKASEMVRHFLETSSKKIGGKAKAMVVTDSIIRAIDYYYAITKILKDSGSNFEAIVAFSGKKEYKGKELTESLINGFSDKETPKEFKKDKYRFLIVADKYQTGYDEPLLHTMYVDKVLNDIKAVQTLSRLNRSCKNKIDTCVLDFANKPEQIEEAFQKYYKQTKLVKETDPNKLYDLLSALDSKDVYDEEQVATVVKNLFDDEPRAYNDAILDVCVERYNSLSEEEQVEFKSGVKSFIRTYNFLVSILSTGQKEWAIKDVFFGVLVNRLPTPREDDLTKGILEAVDMESYRLEKKCELDIILKNMGGEVATPSTGTAIIIDPEIDTLENIINNFNDIFGNVNWEDKDNVAKQIKAIPEMIIKDEKLKNALKNADKENIKIEYSRALLNVMVTIMKDNMELFKQFNDNQLFNKWLSDSVFKVITEEFEKKRKITQVFSEDTYKNLREETTQQASKVADPNPTPFG